MPGLSVINERLENLRRNGKLKVRAGRNKRLRNSLLSRVFEALSRQIPHDGSKTAIRSPSHVGFNSNPRQTNKRIRQLRRQAKLNAGELPTAAPSEASGQGA